MPYRIGDCISFVDLNGFFQCGHIVSSKRDNNNSNFIHEYKVRVSDETIKTAVIDYIIKIGSKVRNVKPILMEDDCGFPLRT